jgi:DNA-binding response OmpR family regulator
MLPKVSGFDVLKRMRDIGDKTPVIILTAKGLETDKVIGLELGADDYITKPFGLKELLARIKAVLRRSEGDKPSDIYKFGNFTFDFRAMEAYDGKKQMELTKREFEIMRIFLRRPGEAISRQDLIAELWEIEGDYYPTTRTVDNYIVKLRKKLGDDPEDPRYIHTVHGIGYKFMG